MAKRSIKSRYRQLNIWNKLFVWAGIATIVGVVLTVLLTVLFFIVSLVFGPTKENQEKILQRTTRSGSLEPSFKKGLLNGNDITVYFGSNTMIKCVEDVGSDRILRPVEGMEIVFAKDSIRVSAKAISTDGKIVAQLTENEWDINPNDSFKMNFDKTALEVVDRYGCPVLQVEFLGRQTVKLAGLFESEGSVVRATDAGLAVSVLSDPRSVAATQSDLKQQALIFRYPRERHFGERAETSNELSMDEISRSPEYKQLKKKYARMSNQELKKETVTLVVEMGSIEREVSKEFPKTPELTREMLEEFKKGHMHGLGEARGKAYENLQSYEKKVHAMMYQIYDASFKIRVLSLREVLISRLGGGSVHKGGAHFFCNPRSKLSYFIISINLETMANALEE